jgi:hypothetical protein
LNKKIIIAVCTLVLTALPFLLFTNSAAAASQRSIISFTTYYSFQPSGNSFTNTQVTGQNIFNFHVQGVSGDPGPRQPLNNAVLKLESQKQLEWSVPPATIAGPPVYQWSFGSITELNYPQGLSAGVNEDNVTFTPGFDVSRSADKTQFTSSGTQTVTITVIPREKISYLSIYTELMENSLVKTTNITPVENATPGAELKKDGSQFYLAIQNPSIGTPYTYEVKTDVVLKPGVEAVQFMPQVGVSAQETIDQGTVSNSPITRPSRWGEWTWSSDGDNIWNWLELQGKNVTFPLIYKASKNIGVILFDEESVYSVDGKDFTDQTVTGSKSWSAFLANPVVNDISTGEPLNTGIIVSPQLSLDSQLRLNLVSSGETVHDSPVYQWSYPDLSGSTGAFTSVDSPENAVTFAPGFDASRTFNSDSFAASGSQIVRIAVTPHKQGVLIIGLRAPENDQVDPRIAISSPVNSGTVITPDNHFLLMVVQNVEIGKKYEYEVAINVTLKGGISNVRYVPVVLVGIADNIILRSPVVTISFSYTMPGLGNWNLQTQGNYVWRAEETTGNVIKFNGYSIPPPPPPPANHQTTAEALPLPSQKTPEQIVTANILTLIIGSLFLLMSAFFNSSIKDNYRLLQAWIRRNKKLSEANSKEEEQSHKFHLKDYLTFSALVIFTALINTFTKLPSDLPEFFSAFVPSLVCVTILTLGYAGIQVLLSNHRFLVPATIRLYFIALFFALIFVVFVWVVKYPPLLIYGFVGGYFALSRKKILGPRQRVRVIFLSVAAILFISISSFFLRQWVHQDSAGFWQVILDNILAKLCCSGLLGLVLYLLPFDFMDGARLRAWNFWAWLFTFYVAMFAFFYFVIVDRSDIRQAMTSDLSVGVYIFMGICILAGMASWLFFKIRTRPIKAPVLANKIELN